MTREHQTESWACGGEPIKLPLLHLNPSWLWERTSQYDMISDVISNINMIFIMSYSKKLATVEHCASLHVLFENTIWNLYYKSMAPSRAPNPVHSVSGVHSPQVFWRGGEDRRSILMVRSVSLRYIWLLEWKLGELSWPSSFSSSHH